MTMRSVDLPDEVIATLRNDAERERVVDTYIRLRDEYRAGRTPFSSDLDNAPREIELALVAESARTRFPKTVLADSYLDLCLFTDPQDVERCRHLRDLDRSRRTPATDGLAD